MLPPIELWTGSGTRRNITSVPTACLVCRRRHLKCDGQCPCSRCITANLDCAYVASRRGYNGRKRMSRAAAEKPFLIAASTAITIDSAPPVAGLEFTSHLDPFMFSGILDSLSGVNTTLPVGTSCQTAASTTLPVLSLQNPLGGIDHPNPGFGFEVPRALPQRERYIDAFYQKFFAAHPFILPKEPLLSLAQGTSVEPLITAIRWIGSLYIDKHASQSLLKDAFRLIDGNHLREGFLVQARLLLIIGLDGIRQRKKANKLMSEARDISVQIGMNTSSFATTHGQGIPILEESWRRTWWELYVVDALMSGVHLTNTFALYEVPTDVGLPCEENQYRSGVSGVKKPCIHAMLTRSSKYLPACTLTIQKISGCSMVNHFHRTPIESNVLASWVGSKECRQMSTISISSSPTGCFAYQLQSMPLFATARLMK
ncbi:hypothetical protein SNK03_007578 [Fusarium graminearum]